VNYMIPFCAMRIYLASVDRAFSNIEPARIAVVPIPTNPNKMVNTLPISSIYTLQIRLEEEICKWLQWNKTSLLSRRGDGIRTYIRTGHESWRATIKEAATVELTLTT